MTSLEAAIAEYTKTILDLQTRLANLASFAAEQQNKNEELAKKLEDIKSGP